jgi:hypothetical protein
MRVNLRLLGARIALRLGARPMKEIDQLLARTAAAFGSPAPRTRARTARGRLREYALFTRDRAEAALDGGAELSVLDRSLFDTGLELGRGYRRRLGLRDDREAMAAARLIYRGLGIDFRRSAEGEVAIRRCSFSAVYSPRVCALVSALDRGLLAGLTEGGLLEFRQRITEGADSCRACFTEAKK